MPGDAIKLRSADIIGELDGTFHFNVEYLNTLRIEMLPSPRHHATAMYATGAPP